MTTCAETSLDEGGPNEASKPFMNVTLDSANNQLHLFFCSCFSLDRKFPSALRICVYMEGGLSSGKSSDP